MKIELIMSESDIVRAMKNTKYSPIQILASRHFKEDIDNVEAKYENIIIWDTEIEDYNLYKYCTEDIALVQTFFDEWMDYVDNYVEEFNAVPISFCVEFCK
jgi:hypothetical protein